jgi:hypothetical protein
LWSPTAAANIAAKYPRARILMILRDPADRAFAQYLHMLTFAKSRVTFQQHLDAFFVSKSRRIGKLYPFLEFGLYEAQVRRYLALFPRGRIQIHLYESYLQNPMALLQTIFRFLDVDDRFQPDLSKRYLQARVPRFYFVNRLVKQLGLWGIARRATAVRRIAFQPRESLTMSPEDRGRLVEYYRDDIAGLARLLDQDLSAWMRV